MYLCKFESLFLIVVAVTRFYECDTKSYSKIYFQVYGWNVEYFDDYQFSFLIFYMDLLLTFINSPGRGEKIRAIAGICRLLRGEKTA